MVNEKVNINKIGVSKDSLTQIYSVRKLKAQVKELEKALLHIKGKLTYLESGIRYGTTRGSYKYES